MFSRVFPPIFPVFFIPSVSQFVQDVPQFFSSWLPSPFPTSSSVLRRFPNLNPHFHKISLNCCIVYLEINSFCLKLWCASNASFTAFFPISWCAVVVPVNYFPSCRNRVTGSTIDFLRCICSYCQKRLW